MHCFKQAARVYELLADFSTRPKVKRIERFDQPLEGSLNHKIAMIVPTGENQETN